MARVLASVPALSVVLAALAASAASPCIVKEMVAVVAVVIGVATLMDVVLRAVESADVSELVRAAVALASAARLAPPVGVITISNVSVADWRRRPYQVRCDDSERRREPAIRTSQPLAPPQTLVVTGPRKEAGSASAGMASSRLDVCVISTVAPSVAPTADASDAARAEAFSPAVAAAPKETAVDATNATGGCGGGDGGELGGIEGEGGGGGGEGFGGGFWTIA